MPHTSRRVGQFTESVIRRMTRVAQACGAINLSQGFPDFDPPAALCEALLKNGAPGLHFYTLNQAGLTTAIWQRLGI